MVKATVADNVSAEAACIEACSTEDSIKRLVAEGALFVSNHSGGKDSQIMLIKLLSLVPAGQLIVVHASLGAMEWPGAMELAAQQASNAGLPFIVARANKTLLEMVERRFESRPEVPSWPSSSTRQCTSDLKRDPIRREVRRYAKANGFTKIVNCLGLRAQESPGRAKRVPLKVDTRTSNGVATWYEWLPVHELKTEEVFAGIANAGQQPHYAYGLGNDRLSCVFCIMASKGDMRNGAEHQPVATGPIRRPRRQDGLHNAHEPYPDPGIGCLSQRNYGMSNSADILDRASNLTPLERAVIDKANAIKVMKADEHLTTIEAAHQVWAIRDILIAVDPKSPIIERLYELEKEVLR